MTSTTTITPQAQLVLTHLKSAGRITQREALMDHSIQSLTRRITELLDAGVRIIKNQKRHPVTGQRYMEYALG